MIVTPIWTSLAVLALVGPAEADSAEVAPAAGATVVPVQVVPTEAVPETDAPPTDASATATEAMEAAEAAAEAAQAAAAEAEAAAAAAIEASEAATATETENEVAGDDGPVLRAATERAGPPYYDDADQAALRARYEISEPEEVVREPVRWRCLIADPTCGTSFEVNATAAYAFRAQQGDVSNGNVRSWHTGRAQYDFWLNLPVLKESRRNTRFTKMTFGPKGGLIFSDTGDFWGNLGVAGRYWLGRGRFAPTIEFSSALAFKLGGRPTRNLAGAEPEFKSQRGPVGFTADVGVGIGGFGAIVIGGQYDSPLAREDVPEQFRVSAAGMFFLGFRGNILWGAPAAAAVVTHGVTQRTVEQPNR